MNAEAWYAKRNDRPLRYAGRIMDAGQRVCLRISPEYASTFEGQVCLLTAANLLARMTPSITIDVPANIPQVVTSPQLVGQFLGEAVLDLMRQLDPYNKFRLGKAEAEDIVVNLGPEGEERVVHSSGWNAYIGSGPSPLPMDKGLNPFGAGLAAVLAMAHLFDKEFVPLEGSYLFDTLHWRTGLTPSNSPAFQPAQDFGEIWIIGTGSVGTALLFFLPMASRKFDAVLIDMDQVKTENLDRSAIFRDADVGRMKVDATSDFLRAQGVRSVRTETAALHESNTWANRSTGQPDILVSAANEKNVRYHIEEMYPPVQIYGTTGKNWQAALIRHLPGDACSCCLFPPTYSAVTKCATAQIDGTDEKDKIDASLPFLSFAAGLMAAAEITKLQLAGFPFSPNRVFLNTRPQMRFVPVEIARREECNCTERSISIHRRMLEGGKYAHLACFERAAQTLGS